MGIAVVDACWVVVVVSSKNRTNWDEHTKVLSTPFPTGRGFE